MIEPNSDVFYVLWTLSLILIIIMSILSVYLFRIVMNKRKIYNKIKLDLPFSIYLLLLSLLISRILLFYFDYYLTKFDRNVYYIMPNIIFLRVAFCVSMLGLGILLFTIDRKALDFKLKGILGYLEVITIIPILFLPVNSYADLQLWEFLTTIGASIAIFVPIFFIGLAIKAPLGSDMRKFSIAFSTSFMLYVLGASFQGEFFINVVSDLYGNQAIIVLRIITSTMIGFGLSLMAYASSKIKIS